MKPILEIQNISKKFRIRHEKQPYLSLRDSLTSLFRQSTSSSEEFYALREVSFNVSPGESIGIIGKNGAGKSTLLKILSKITPPTSGKIISRGRIASLLEVGTGFHSELSGRENIFLNGSILGMKRNEIQKNFDEIVDFAGVEKFLDTPLKHYSSGMQLRLAFAVAAFLENEILIIDEVLAVGDAEFQKKCMGKMEDVTKNGRTILFVSHSMPAVQALCNKSLILNKGKSEGIMLTSKAVSEYLNEHKYNSAHFINSTMKNTAKEAVITEAKILNSENKVTNSLLNSEGIKIEITWNNLSGKPVTPNFSMINQNSHIVMVAMDTPADMDGRKKMQVGTYINTFIIKKYLLNTGNYHLHIALNNGFSNDCYDVHPYALNFSILDPMNELSINRGIFKSITENAILWPALECEFKKI